MHIFHLCIVDKIRNRQAFWGKIPLQDIARAGPLFAHKKPFRKKVFQVMRGAALEGMGGGTNGDIIFRNIFFVVVKFFWIIPFDKGKADLAIVQKLQKLFGIAIVQVNIGVRVRFQIAGESTGNRIFADCHCDSDGERFNALVVFVKFFLDRRFVIFHAKQPFL